MWWLVLGVNASDDEKTVKKAYAQKLKTINQDNEIELFSKVHNAYREAMKSFKTKISKETYFNRTADETDWYMSELLALYEDPTRRFEVSAWKNLFDCMSFKEELDFRNKYIDFFNAHPYLTTDIWRTIENYYPLKQGKTFNYTDLCFGYLEITANDIMLLPLDKGMAYVTQKIDTYYLMRKGLYSQALELIESLIAIKPTSEILRWQLVANLFEMHSDSDGGGNSIVGSKAIVEALVSRISEDKNEFYLAQYLYAGYLFQLGMHKEAQTIMRKIEPTIQVLPWVETGGDENKKKKASRSIFKSLPTSNKQQHLTKVQTLLQLEIWSRSWEDVDRILAGISTQQSLINILDRRFKDLGTDKDVQELKTLMYFLRIQSQKVRQNRLDIVLDGKLFMASRVGKLLKYEFSWPMHDFCAYSLAEFIVLILKSVEGGLLENQQRDMYLEKAIIRIDEKFGSFQAFETRVGLCREIIEI